MTIKILISAASAVLLSASPPDAECVAARIGAKTITCHDVEKAVAFAQLRADADLMKAKNEVIERLVDRYLLELEASNRGLSPNDYLNKEVGDAVQRPSDVEIDVILELFPTRFGGTSSADKRKTVYDAILSARRGEATASIYKRLRARYSAEVITRRMPMPKVTIDALSYVNPLAERQAYVFSDFECPYCALLAQAIGRLKGDLPPGIGVSFVNYPLPNHPMGKLASLSAICAAQQGRFAEYHDRVFSRNGKLTAATIDLDARAAVKDVTQYQTCMGSPEASAKLESQITTARQLRLGGTPVVYFEGEFIEGFPGPDKIRSLLIPTR